MVPTVPESNVEVAMLSRVVATGAAATVMDNKSDFVWTGLLLSLTVTVKLNFPLAVGVPAMAPLPDASLNPAGRLPDVIDQVYGAVPPLAARLTLYDVPTTPEDNEAVEMATGRATFVPDETIAIGTDCDACPV